jgi:hypothetical protein
MRSASKAWPSRLLAATVVLALAAAYAIGAYAHAAGHQPPQAGHAEALSDTDGHDGHASASVAAAPDHGDACGHAGCGHGEDHPSHSLDCCDTICHGGQAILAAAPVVPAALRAAPPIGPAAALHGADASGLDRPPKPFRSI